MKINKINEKVSFYMLELRKLEVSDKDKMEELLRKIKINLENELFWLPITTESKEHFFDEEWTYFLGMFDGEELVAAVGLFFNINEYKDSEKILKLQNCKIAEIGRAMVAPEYRHNGFMNKITKELINYAKEQKIQYLVATAHPENIPSQKTLKALGMVKKASCVKHGKYERDVFLLRCYEI